MSTVVICAQCARALKFEDGERGQAWIKVEVVDGDECETGDDSFLMSAEFCSPECAHDFLMNPAMMGTIRFPESPSLSLRSGPCAMNAHSVCGGQAVQACRCPCHKKKG